MKKYFLLLTLLATPFLIAITYQQRVKARRLEAAQYEDEEYGDEESENSYEYAESSSYQAPAVTCPNGQCVFHRTSQDVSEMRQIYGDPFSTPSDDVRFKELIEGLSRP